MVGITTYVLQVLTWSAKIYVLVVAKPFLLLCNSEAPSGWATQIPLQSPWCKIRVGPPIKLPTMLEQEMALAVPHSKFSFLTRGCGGLVEPLCVLLHCPGEGVMWLMCSHFSYASNAVCLGL